MTASTIPTPLDTARAAHLAEQGRALFPLNYGARDITMVRGAGSRCWDATGREYLDFLGGIAVNNVGHCHPAVVEAIKRQAEQLLHCSNFFMAESQLQLAERLLSTTGMARVFFCNSGTEATEAAIKMARLFARNARGPGHHKVLVFEGSFHGRTYGAMSATWSPKVRTGFDPLLDGFEFARLNDIESVEAVLDSSFAAVLVETVQGEGGVIPCAPGFLAGLRALCDKHGVLLICDEIQCGMGRCGRPMAYMGAKARPDLVPLAKAIGGGLPLGALMMSQGVADVMQPGVHGTTFGGNPVACAAGVAVCDIVFDPEFLGAVGEKGCHWWGILESLHQQYPDHCSHVRGLGLMQGLVLKVPGAKAVEIGRKHGLLFNCTADKVLRFLPPLTTTVDEIDEAAAKLRATFAEFVEQVPACA